MDLGPRLDKKYYEHMRKTHRNDLYPEDPTTKMQEDHPEDHPEDHLEDHLEGITQAQATKGDKTLI